ncbi:MAG: aminoglycoside phosphotransferase family protein [Vallitaleaceae bacterium]|nr:aminoglycoside phosphotransferase family protein [Vallitaleaceae bacterium]
MESTTKTQIDPNAVKKICDRIYGKNCAISEIKELADGCYNASYMVHVESENCDIIIKAAPSDDIPILSYEKDIMKTEVHLYKKVKEATKIPIPALIDVNFERDLTGVPYFVSERLYGQPLNKVEALSYETRKILYTQLAKYLALLHKIEGDHYGYPALKKEFGTYRETFLDMVGILVKDGQKVGAGFPIDYEDFFKLIENHSDVLEDVKRPILVHFDLWDGNVFVKDMESNPTIEGLIDFERSFYGDRLGDLMQASFNIDLEKDTYFLDTYNAHTDEKIIYGSREKKRVLLHKIYLFAIMIIESKFRDVNGSYDGQLGWASEEFTKLIQQLKDFGGQYE